MRLNASSINGRQFYSVQSVSELLDADFELEALNDACEALRLFPIMADNKVCYHADVWREAYALDVTNWGAK